MFNRKRILMQTAANELDPFARERQRLEAHAAGALDVDAPSPDELGAFGGVADIPGRLYVQQQWAGQAFGREPISNSNLVRINLPIQFARDWTIQLAAPSVPSGAPVAFASTFATGDGTFVPAGTQPGSVKVTWGHHGATETVIMDWPQMGGSLTVHGAFVEVSVSDPGDPGNGRLANYAAWCSEGSAARAGLPPFQPVRTFLQVGLGPAAASGLIPLAPRCRAWSLTATTPEAFEAAMAPLRVNFLDNGAAQRGRYYVYTDLIANRLNILSEMAQPRPIPIHANVVQLTNTDINFGHTWDDIAFIQWLDVGS